MEELDNIGNLEAGKWEVKVHLYTMSGQTQIDLSGVTLWIQSAATSGGPWHNVMMGETNKSGNYTFSDVDIPNNSYYRIQEPNTSAATSANLKTGESTQIYFLLSGFLCTVGMTFKDNNQSPIPSGVTWHVVFAGNETSGKTTNSADTASVWAVSGLDLTISCDHILMNECEPYDMMFSVSKPASTEGVSFDIVFYPASTFVDKPINVYYKKGETKEQLSAGTLVLDAKIEKAPWSGSSHVEVNPDDGNKFQIPVSTKLGDSVSGSVMCYIPYEAKMSGRTDLGESYFTWYYYATDIPEIVFPAKEVWWFSKNIKPGIGEGPITANTTGTAEISLPLLPGVIESGTAETSGYTLTSITSADTFINYNAALTYGNYSGETKLESISGYTMDEEPENIPDTIVSLTKIPNTYVETSGFTISVDRPEGYDSLIEAPKEKFSAQFSGETCEITNYEQWLSGDTMTLNITIKIKDTTSPSPKPIEPIFTNLE